MKNISIRELKTLPLGTLFQMDRSKTTLNEHEVYPYPEELACLCRKGNTDVNGSFEYHVIVPLNPRVCITPVEKPLIFKTLDELHPDFENPVIDERPIITIFTFSDLRVLYNHLKTALILTAAFDKEEFDRDYLNVWTLPTNHS